jgi:16S rRNA C1402 N4-methylase RsmH
MSYHSLEDRIVKQAFAVGPVVGSVDLPVVPAGSGPTCACSHPGSRASHRGRTTHARLR